MPPKIRELKARLKKAGFSSRAGKGSHTVWEREDRPDIAVVLSGKDGQDAKPYQIDDVNEAIKKIQEGK
jgi:predicted RNA binding protein YcfA (HicA-like mRNA interferase family)